MTERNWRGALASQMDQAKASLIKHGELPARFTLFLPDGSLRIYDVNFLNPGQKAGAMKFIAMAAMAYNADGLCTVVEAWAASVPIDDKTPDQQLAELDKGGFQASKQPDRFEVVYAAMAYYGTDDKREIIGAMGKIKRGPSKRVLDLTDVEFSEAGEGILGAMAGTLPAERKRASVRNQARDLLARMPHGLLEELSIKASVA